MLSFQSMLSRVLDCMILQFSFINSSVISLVMVSYFYINCNLSFGQWFNHSKLCRILANFISALCSSSNGLNKMFTSLNVSPASCRIFRLSSEVSELWLMLRCSNLSELMPARVAIRLWLASSFFRFFRFSSSTKLVS